MRASTVYITEEYDGTSEFPNDAGNFPGSFEINQDRSHQVEGETDLTSDLIAVIQLARVGCVLFAVLIVFYLELIQKFRNAKLLSINILY